MVIFMFNAHFQLSVDVCDALMQHFQHFLLVCWLASLSAYKLTQIFYLSILKVILLFILCSVSFRQSLELVLQLVLSLFFVFGKGGVGEAHFLDEVGHLLDVFNADFLMRGHL